MAELRELVTRSVADAAVQGARWESVAGDWRASLTRRSTRRPGRPRVAS